MMDTIPGRIVIISGPSGAGKSTVVRQLLESCNVPLTLSVSATTRPPRKGEVHGREYFFLSHAEFSTKRKAGEFLECKEVFGRGDWYGSLRQVVSTGLDQGKWVILEIDVDGALEVMNQVRDAISIFVHPGSMDELERRLRARGTETEQAIARRLDVANHEMSLRHHYQYEVINTTVEQTVKKICSLLLQLQGDPVACSKN
jgi:guanylate kinase